MTLYRGLRFSTRLLACDAEIEGIEGVAGAVDALLSFNGAVIHNKRSAAASMSNMVTSQR
jgi:hypothetical protein